MCSVDATTGIRNVSIWIYSNTDLIELFVNGASQGNKTMNKTAKTPMGRTASSHVTWMIPFVAGTISAKGYVDGKVVAQDIRETTGPPVTLGLSMEWPVNGGLKADNADVALVTVSLLDAKKRLVPTASA